jgi:hypothetical protein
LPTNLIFKLKKMKWENNKHVITPNSESPWLLSWTGVYRKFQRTKS